MAIDATELYLRFEAEHDEEMQALRLKREDPLDVDQFQRARSSQASRALNDRNGPLVIVASSGMAEGGRVVHHLKQRLPDPRNVIIFVGYQASGTRGRALVDGAETVSIHGSRGAGGSRGAPRLEPLRPRRPRRTRPLGGRARPANRIASS